MMMITMITITMTAMIPIITFLFFHHILFFTLRDVSLRSYDWSARVSLFFTRISILSPLSITLSIFFKADSSNSDNSFLRLDSLSTSVLFWYLLIQSCKMGLKSLSEWPTAEALLCESYLEKKASCIFLRKLTAILI